MNRRMRARMSGGVGGGRAIRSPTRLRAVPAAFTSPLTGELSPARRRGRLGVTH